MGLRTVGDPCGGLTPLVDKWIGEAYPTVKFVSDNLPIIANAAELVSGLNATLAAEAVTRAAGDTGLNTALTIEATARIAGQLATSVKSAPYNAIADGVANDTVAIQAALNAGVPLYCPPGVYLLDPLTIPTGTVIIGAGRGLTTFKRRNGSATGSLFSLATNAANITFSGFTLDGNKANNSNGFCISGTNIASFRMEDVAVQNDAVAGAFFATMNPNGGSQATVIADCTFSGCTAGGLAFNGARNVTIERCRFVANGAQGAGFSSFDSDGIIVRGNYFLANGSHGLFLNCDVTGNPVVLTYTINNVSVSDNYSQGNLGYGIIVQAKHATVTGNLCVSNGNFGGSYNFAGFLLNSDRCTITGNTALSNFGNGFDLGSSTRFTFSGNVAELSGYYGFEVDACFQGTVVGNTAANNWVLNPGFTQQAGIYHGPGSVLGGSPLATSTDRVAFVGNTVTSGAHQTYGLYIDATVTNTTVVGNDMIASGQTDDLFCAASVASISGNLTRWTSGNVSGPLVSAAAMFLPDGSDYFEISGTTTINQLVPNGTRAGRVVTLFFQGALTLGFNVAANGFVLSGSANFVATVGSMITLRQRFDGKWYEESRAVR